jgi:hypothetical protein
LAEAVRDVVAELDRVKSLVAEPLAGALDDLSRRDDVIPELEAALLEEVGCDKGW